MKTSALYKESFFCFPFALGCFAHLLRSAPSTYSSLFQLVFQDFMRQRQPQPSHTAIWRNEIEFYNFLNLCEDNLNLLLSSQKDGGHTFLTILSLNLGAVLVHL